jgi:hypothetical protein
LMTATFVVMLVVGAAILGATVFTLIPGQC